VFGGNRDLQNVGQKFGSSFPKKLAVKNVKISVRFRTRSRHDIVNWYWKIGKLRCRLQ